MSLSATKASAGSQSSTAPRATGLNGRLLAGADRCGHWQRLRLGSRRRPSHEPVYATDSFTNTSFAAGDTVSVIDGVTCNATVRTGCSQPPAEVTVGPTPISVAVDEQTNTVYVTNYDFELGNTVSMINGAACDSASTSGCAQVPPTVTVGYGPEGVDVDQASNAVFVGDSTEDTVAKFNGIHCNGIDTSGCPQTASQVTVGGIPLFLAVDQATGAVLVPNVADNDVSVLARPNHMFNQ